MKITSPKIKNSIESNILDSIKENNFSNKIYSTNIEENIIKTSIILTKEDFLEKK